MFRKTMVALAAIVTLSMVNIASSPTDARGGFRRYRHPRYYGYVYANPVAYVGYPTAHFFGYPIYYGGVYGYRGYYCGASCPGTINW